MEMYGARDRPPGWRGFPRKISTSGARLLNTTAWTISIQNMSCDERKAVMSGAMLFDERKSPPKGNVVIDRSVNFCYFL